MWIYRTAVNCALNRLGLPGVQADFRPGEESKPAEKGGGDQRPPIG